VQPGSTSQSGVRYGWGSRTTLRAPDVQAILRECPAIAYATPSLRGGFQVVYANQNWPNAVQGTGVEYLSIFDWPLASGEWFTAQDIDAASKVAVLGDTVREMLFGSVDPVGQVMQIKNIPFRIIGVLEPKGQSAWGQDQDDIIFIPYTTAQKKVIGTSAIYAILAAAGSSAELPQAVEQITGLLRQRHRLQPWQENDFSIQPLAAMAAAEEESTRVMTILLGSIASISLLVGGIGIMNIMLATVLERTREIGIRRAIGARQGDIVRQFLTEAVLISIVGGLIGIAFGFTLSKTIAWQAGWSTVVTTSSIVVAFGVSVFIGLLFGIYPAVQAAKLDPIEAIRYE
jgi:putative ABC transport system permease protein